MGKKNGGNQLRLPPQARTEKGRLPLEEKGSRGKGKVSSVGSNSKRFFDKLRMTAMLF